ncbi:hypothetical protein ACMG4P_03965 [Pseudovibrio denitrificans]|uniref:hypothetical protein n=1 Tax=Pseudovibrio denitrificans TaxID=258256 RepID=UPI0039BEF377
MTLFDLWGLWALILALGISWFCKSRVCRWVLIVNGVLAFVANAAEFWAFDYFQSIDCMGNILKGYVCPESVQLTAQEQMLKTLAFSHSVVWAGMIMYIGLLMYSGVIFVVPIILLVFECLARKSS